MRWTVGQPVFRPGARPGGSGRHRFGHFFGDLPEGRDLGRAEDTGPYHEAVSLPALAFGRREAHRAAR